MDWKDTFSRFWMLMTRTSETWADLAQSIAKKPTESVKEDQDFLRHFIILVAAFAFLSGLIHSDGPQPIGSILKAIVSGISFYGALPLCAVLIRWILPKLGQKSTHHTTTNRFVIYSMTLDMVVFSILTLLPQLFFLYIAILYTYYIVWEGAGQILEVADDKRTSTSVILTVIVVLVPIVLQKIMLLLIPIAN